MARSFVLALCQKGLLEAAIGVEFHQSSVVFSCNYLKLIPSKKTKLFRDQGLSLVCLWHLGPSHDCIVWQRPNALKWHLSPVSAMIRFGGQHKNFLAGQSGEEPRKSTLHSYSILSTLSLSLSLCIYIYIVYFQHWNEETNSTYICMMLHVSSFPYIGHKTLISTNLLNQRIDTFGEPSFRQLACCYFP